MRLPHLSRPRLSYANVTSTLALVIATSTGGAYAAATIGSTDIEDKAVKSRHIAGSNFGNSAPCPAASQIQIRVYQPGTTTEANGNFNIAIF